MFGQSQCLNCLTTFWQTLEDSSWILHFGIVVDITFRVGRQDQTPFSNPVGLISNSERTIPSIHTHSKWNALHITVKNMKKSTNALSRTPKTNGMKKENPWNDTVPISKTCVRLNVVTIVSHIFVPREVEPAEAIFVLRR